MTSCSENPNCHVNEEVTAIEGTAFGLIGSFLICFGISILVGLYRKYYIAKQLLGSDGITNAVATITHKDSFSKKVGKNGRKKTFMVSYEFSARRSTDTTAFRVTVNNAPVSEHAYSQLTVGSAAKVRCLEREPRRCTLQVVAQEAMQLTKDEGHQLLGSAVFIIAGGILCCATVWMGVDDLTRCTGPVILGIALILGSVPFFNGVTLQHSFFCGLETLIQSDDAPTPPYTEFSAGRGGSSRVVTIEDIHSDQVGKMVVAMVPAQPVVVVAVPIDVTTSFGAQPVTGYGTTWQPAS